MCFLVHINHKKHMVEANVVYVRHKNTYERGWPPFMCYSVVHMNPKTTKKWREKLISPPHTYPSPHLPLTTASPPPSNHTCLVLSSLGMSRLGSSNLFLSSPLQKTNQPTRCGYCLFFCIRLRSSRTVTFTLSCLVLSCLGINIC
jgi:hypothetical protein